MANKFGSQTVTALKVGSYDVTRIIHKNTILYGSDYNLPNIPTSETWNYSYDEEAQTVTITLSNPKDRTLYRMAQNRLGLAVWCKDMEHVGRMYYRTDNGYKTKEGIVSMRGRVRPTAHTVKTVLMSSNTIVIDVSDINFEFGHGFRRGIKRNAQVDFIRFKIRPFIIPENCAATSKDRLKRYIPEYEGSNYFIKRF